MNIQLISLSSVQCCWKNLLVVLLETLDVLKMLWLFFAIFNTTQRRCRQSPKPLLGGLYRGERAHMLVTKVPT